MRVNKPKSYIQSGRMQRSLFALLACVAASALEPALAQTCSSLNGPFCSGVSMDYPLPPAHAALNLDRPEEELQKEELEKRVKIEKILKQFELEAARDSDQTQHDQIVEELELLLDHTAALLSASEQQKQQEESPIAGSFAFSNDNGAFELLEKMNGDELKDFFELALDEVLDSYDVTLDEMSPEIAQGIHLTTKQMKALKEVKGYRFALLNASARANIRSKYANHRIVVIQQAFEELVVARTTQERQMALEVSIFLFQLAHEASEKQQPAVAPEGSATSSVSA